MKGLREGGLNVYHGDPSKIFGILKTGLKRPDYIHFDWETNYYQRRTWWMTLINVPIFILQVLFVRYLLGVKLVWTPHNVRPHDAQHIRLHRFCRHFFGSQMAWIRVFSSATVDRIAAELRLSPSRFKVVPEGSYGDYYPNHTTREEARQKLGMSDQQTVFLYMGYIKPYKGIVEMINAFKVQFKEEVLIIAGQIMDKQYGKEVLSHRSDRILVVDQFISDKEIQLYMNVADAVVLPFRNIENSGSVILAMGFGKVVLAPDMGAVSERLSNQSGLLYKHDIAESFEAWKKLRIEEREAIGMANRRALDKFDWIDFSKLFLS